MNDVASGVPVVRPHVHVQHGLFVEASGKCSQRVLKTPRLLWDERENQLSLKCSRKVSFNGVHHGILILDLLPVPNLHAQRLCVQSIRNQPVCTTKLIREAEVWSSGESRVDYLKTSAHSSRSQTPHLTARLKNLPWLATQARFRGRHMRLNGTVLSRPCARAPSGH